MVKMRGAGINCIKENLYTWVQRNTFMVSKGQQWVVAGTLQPWNRGKEGTPKAGKPEVDVKKDKKCK